MVCIWKMSVQSNLLQVILESTCAASVDTSSSNRNFVL